MCQRSSDSGSAEATDPADPHPSLVWERPDDAADGRSPGFGPVIPVRSSRVW